MTRGGIWRPVCSVLVALWSSGPGPRKGPLREVREEPSRALAHVPRLGAQGPQSAPAQEEAGAAASQSLAPGPRVGPEGRRGDAQALQREVPREVVVLQVAEDVKGVLSTVRPQLERLELQLNPMYS